MDLIKEIKCIKKRLCKLAEDISLQINNSIKIHNELEEIQGGTENERYHFNELQHTKVLELIYENNFSTISVNPTSSERGIVTALNITYNIISNDDVFVSASINNGIGSVFENIDTGANTVSIGDVTNNKTITLAMSYTRKDVLLVENKIVNFITYVPQFAGVAPLAYFTTYAQMTANLQKFIQASATLQITSSPESQYIWFVSNKNNATILDQNNFSQTVGAWDNGTTEFYTKSLSLLLNNGSSVTVYLYRSRNTKTFNNFTYKIQ